MPGGVISSEYWTSHGPFHSSTHCIDAGTPPTSSAQCQVVFRCLTPGLGVIMFRIVKSSQREISHITRTRVSSIGRSPIYTTTMTIRRSNYQRNSHFPSINNRKQMK